MSLGRWSPSALEAPRTEALLSVTGSPRSTHDLLGPENAGPWFPGHRPFCPRLRVLSCSHTWATHSMSSEPHKVDPSPGPPFQNCPRPSAPSGPAASPSGFSGRGARRSGRNPREAGTSQQGSAAVPVSPQPGGRRGPISTLPPGSALGTLPAQVSEQSDSHAPAAAPSRRLQTPVIGSGAHPRPPRTTRPPTLSLPLLIRTCILTTPRWALFTVAPG